jgi:hypothetical protein
MRTVAAFAAISLASGPVLAAPVPPTDPTTAPAPAVLIAQAGIDALDSDLAEEESIEEIQDREFDADAWSMGAGIGLSLIPGAGWGLIYADKPAQSTVPFLLSAVGYVIGGLYVAGLFDEESSLTCQHDADGRVGLPECGYADITYDPTAPSDRIDNLDIDRRDPAMRQYFATRSDYELVTQGEDFDGTTTGLVIIGGTYVLTTLIGAIWAGATVYDHNDQLRKDIESTAGASGVASAPAEVPTTARPIVGYTGDSGLFGIALDF